MFEILFLHLKNPYACLLNYFSLINVINHSKYTSLIKISMLVGCSPFLVDLLKS